MTINSYFAEILPLTIIDNLQIIDLHYYFKIDPNDYWTGIRQKSHPKTTQFPRDTVQNIAFCIFSPLPGPLPPSEYNLSSFNMGVVTSRISCRASLQSLYQGS